MEATGQLTIETNLLAEDWAAIAQILGAAGRGPDDGLPWLLELGLNRYVQDEAEWKTLDGREDEEAVARRQELKRREADALLISMRASTLAAEIIMHDLGERVSALGDEMEAHRRKMWTLREENAALEARAGGSAAPDRHGDTTPTVRRTLLERLKDRIWALGRHHE